MHAGAQTRAMLDWWESRGLIRADLAVRRPTGAMIWHHDVALDRLPLGWARAENVQHADVYIRPARGASWPVAFVDDVANDRARPLADEHDVLVVHTSLAGGCHVWLRCDRPLPEPERAAVQRWWVAQIDGDPASVSGEHLGRLAGFRNWKRHGCWVNVLPVSAIGPAWNPTAALAQHALLAGTRTAPGAASARGYDRSPSGRDWAWVCAMLEANVNAPDAYARLVDCARARRGDDVERYARRTIERAIAHVQRTSTRKSRTRPAP
jgi:hypothetical protein